MTKLERFVYPTANGCVRSIFNDPATTIHVTGRLLGWIVAWDGVGTIKAHISRRASNEARKVKRMRDWERADYFQRWDRVRIFATNQARLWGKKSLDNRAK